VPFNTIPPLHLTLSTFDGTTLRVLYLSLHNGEGDSDDQSFVDLMKLVPKGSVVILTVGDTGQLRNVTRLVYRLNGGGGDGGTNNEDMEDREWAFKNRCR